jgi:hypothetical protein
MKTLAILFLLLLLLFNPSAHAVEMHVSVAESVDEPIEGLPSGNAEFVKI